jgi:hypothetical protein
MKIALGAAKEVFSVINFLSLLMQLLIIRVNMFMSILCLVFYAENRAFKFLLGKILKLWIDMRLWYFSIDYMRYLHWICFHFSLVKIYCNDQCSSMAVNY